MIAYKYKLYKTKNTKHIDNMLREASFVWNHAISLQKRYYRIYGKYIPCARLQKHFAKRIKRTYIASSTMQELLQRLDISYNRFFKHLAKRPPKYKKYVNFQSVVYKLDSYSLNGNVLTLRNIKKCYKFSKSRDYEGKIKRIAVKRSSIGDYYVIITTDANPKKYTKSHNGASVGIDFGLKMYLTLSNGEEIFNPQFLKKNLFKKRKADRKLSMAKKGSNHRKQRRKELNRINESITNSRSDFQWKLAHSLCKQYDSIFIEDLNLLGMSKLWGRKMGDLSHASFVEKLKLVADKYDVIVHKIDRWYPSSKSCECGYIHNKLKLSDRSWVCPICGKINDRDLNAAKNILRKGISELKSDNKTLDACA